MNFQRHDTKFCGAASQVEIVDADQLTKWRQLTKCGAHSHPLLARSVLLLFASSTQHPQLFFSLHPHYSGLLMVK